jgi:hypothetical protein
MGQCRYVVEGPDVRMSVVSVRRGELQTSETKEQREQYDPSCHGYDCLSATSNWPLRGKA